MSKLPVALRRKLGLRTDAAGRHDLRRQLADIIAARGLTAYAVGRMADVDPGVIARFLDGRRDIRLETAARIAAALRLRLVEIGDRRAARRAGPATLPPPDSAEGTDLADPGPVTCDQAISGA